MYQVFNMGHRLEFYLDVDDAKKIIDISNSFNIDAKIIGKVEKANKKMLSIKSDRGQFDYY